MNDNHASKKAMSAAVGIGLVGAVAGAAVGVAVSDEKNRKKLLNLAKDANTALQKLMENLETDLPEAKDVQKKAEKLVKQVKKDVKNLQKDSNP